MDGFQPEVQIDVRALRGADECVAEVLRRGHNFFQASHRPRAVLEVPDTDGEGRTVLATDD
ncbi:hypothetical protein GCM10009696_36120 [Kocuria himachalensis]